MEKILTLQLLLLTTLLSGQHFAAPATRWEYCFMHDFEIPPTESYSRIVIEATDSLTIDGIRCSILRIIQDIQILSNDSLIICQDNDRVYFTENDSMHLLYDFALNTGDTFSYKMPESLFSGYFESYEEEYVAATQPMQAVILQADTVLIQGIPVKRQIVRHLEYHYVTFGDTIYQYLGNSSFLLPFFSVDWAELNPGSDLTGYHGQAMDLMRVHAYCPTSGIDVTRDHTFHATFPNPVQHVLHLNTTGAEFLHAYVVSVEGAYRMSVDFNDSNSYDLHELNAGMYLLIMIDTEGVYHIHKFVKVE